MTARTAAGRLQIVNARPESAGEWDAFAVAAEGGSFCHLSAWREIMHDVLGHDVSMLEARDDDGALRGILPLVRVKSALFGHFLVSMPFLNDGGALGDGEAVAALAAHGVDEARRLKVDLLELRGRTAPPPALEACNRKITVQMPLPQHPDVLWRAFPAKLRSQIKRAQKEEFEMRFGAGECEPFYEVFARGMRTLGTPVLPREWFTRIAAAMPGVVDFAVVYDGFEPIAAGCGFHWRGTFELTWAASLVEYRPLAPNMQLYWSLMERAIERGTRVFDFGRCTPGGGTHRFKSQWRGTDVPLPWAQWSARDVVSIPTPDRPLFRVATYCWKKLPLSVTNRVGPVLARSIP